MKKAMLVGIAVTLLAGPLCAAEKSLGLTLAQIESDRKNIIEEVVAPSADQSEAFWRNYWQYRGGVKLLTDRTLEVIEEFNATGWSMSGNRSAALVIEVMDIEKRRADLKQTRVKEFQKILNSNQVVRWYQAERKMDALIRADLALAIPFNDLAAQADGELTEEIIVESREELIEAIVQLQEDQVRPFRYDYRIYSDKLTKLYDRTGTLVEEYAKNYGSISDVQAKKMLEEATAIDTERVKILKTLIYSLRAELTGKQMSRLMQGELKMRAIMDVAMAALIPLNE